MFRFAKEFSSLEAGLAITFLVLYIAYIIRNYLIAKRLRTKTRAIWLKFFWRSAYFALLILSLLGPGYGLTDKEVKAEGKDIMLAIDLSESMNAQDVPPSRLSRVKLEVEKLMQRFNGNRIGLIIFSGEAFVQCPLTYDHSALRMFLESLNTDLISGGGTDFGAAFNLANKKLVPKETESSGSPSTKVLVLFSDGEDFGEDSEDEAKELSDNQVKLFAVGIGTAEGGSIPAAGGFKRDREGKKVITKLSSEALKEYAGITGGGYYEINNEVNESEVMLNEISKVKASVRSVKQYDVAANKYYYFLALALLMMVADVIFTIKVVRL